MIETAAVRVERGVCFYNEVFSFEISSREGDLRLCLIKVDPNSGREELVGDCSVLLQDLSGETAQCIYSLSSTGLPFFVLLS